MTPLQLKLARIALGLTVRQAAALAQVSHETIVGIPAPPSAIGVVSFLASTARAATVNRNSSAVV